MKILVTGGAGFIGSHLVDRLITAKHEVIVIDDLSGGSINNVNVKARFIQADCRSEKAMDLAFNMHRPQIVFHLAANAAENKAQFSPVDITSRNYDAFIKVLKPFIKYGGARFVYTSSIAVYGSLQTPFREDDIPDPEDLYGITKLAAEKTLKVMSKVHNFEYVIVRPHNVYGPRQNMRDPYRNVVTIFMNAVLHRMPYFIYGDGEQTRCFSYIDDVVDAIKRCGFLDVSGKTFNLGSDLDYSLNELSEMIMKITYFKKKPHYIAERLQEVKEAVADHHQARIHLQYKDKTTLSNGLHSTWRWAQKQGAQKPVYTTIEIPSKKLPINWQV